MSDSVPMAECVSSLLFNFSLPHDSQQHFLCSWSLFSCCLSSSSLYFAVLSNAANRYEICPECFLSRGQGYFLCLLKRWKTCIYLFVCFANRDWTHDLRLVRQWLVPLSWAIFPAKNMLLNYRCMLLIYAWNPYCLRVIFISLDGTLDEEFKYWV